MSVASTFSALIEMYKKLYLSRSLTNMALRRTPAFKVIKKYDDLDGEGQFYGLNVALPVGASASRSKAKTNTKPSKFKKWFLQRKKYYGFVQIEGEGLHASRRDPAAYLRLKKKEMDEMLAYIGMQIGASWWGDGAGNIGRVSAVTGSNPVTAITLTDTNDVINFHENQRIVFAATRTGGSTRVDGSAVEVIYQVDKVNLMGTTAQLTVSRVQGTLAASDPVANDYIYIDGNYDQMMHGFSAYVPASDPGVSGVPGTLNNVDRTTNPTQLAGFRGTWEGSITESAKRLAAQMGRFHTTPTSALWLNDMNWFRLEQEQEQLGKATRDQNAEAVFGTAALVLNTPRGRIPVMADPFMPMDFGALVDHETWELHHMEGLPHIVSDDGLQSLRMPGDDDGIQIDIRAWLNGVCTSPFRNGRFPIQ